MLDILKLGIVVKQARKSLKLTQRQIASQADVSRTILEALENQRIPEIGFKKLMRILHAVGLDLRVTTLNRNRPTLEDLTQEKNLEHDTRLVR